MEYRGVERRRAERIRYPYLIRVRELEVLSPEDMWDVSSVRDISRTGIYFYSSRFYGLGAGLEVAVKNPLRQSENKCRVTVVREEGLVSIEKFCGIAADIKAVDNREAFEETIDYFLKIRR